MKTQKLAALASALCLLQTGLPVAELSAMAAEEVLTYGVLTYETVDGCVTITGCDDTVESVEIPAEIEGMSVTKIGSTAFYGSTLTSVEIPEGVTEIGSGAFWHSKSLAEVTLPSTLMTIEGNAFNDCQALENIDFPESVTYIGASVFDATPWLEAQKEKTPFVVVNNILVDASAAVKKEQEAIEKAKEEAKQRANIITNQVGYFTNQNKRATLISEEKSGVKFELLNADGLVVWEGISEPFGFDAPSGDNVHILDFSEFNIDGTYMLKAETGEKSRAFEIGVIDNYSGLLFDALNYFYQNRSGIEIEEKYITSGDTAALARAAGHAPDIAEIQHIFDYEASEGKQDVTGGWYDAGDHGKYVVNGGVSLWLMQNQYERAAQLGTAEAYQDGAMKIPENGNGYPDLLDEARYEMEWMLTMIVQDGDCEGMVYHKVHDNVWTALGTPPAKDLQPRIIHPPTTAATLNLAACGAQAYRLWKDIDAEFAERCLTAAQTAYEAAKAHPEMYAPNKEFGGGGAYNDSNVTDEFYWAACELYTSTGDESYYADLQSYPSAFEIPYRLGGPDGVTGSFDWGSTGALGSLTLLLHGDVLADAERTTLQTNLLTSANAYLKMESEQGYGLPYQSAPIWASNSFVTDNTIVLAYAYDLSQKQDYLDGVISAMDYILGHNPMDNSYVTGYGERSSQYPHHRFWAIAKSSALPKAPCGVMVGGPNMGMEDSMMKAQKFDKLGTAPLRYYLDDIEAYSVNECAINWNTSLAWVTGFICEQNGGIIVGQPSAGKQIYNPEDGGYDPKRVDPLTLVIPEGITTVGEQIFDSKTKDYVTEVVVPDTVTEISKKAFYNGVNLKSIVLPDSIEVVGEQAFAKTPWLTEKLAESPLLIINGLLIDGTTTTGDVVIPEGVTSILGNAFNANTGITSVTIPEGTETIGANAFLGCEKLTTVSLPDSLKTIRANAFSDTALEELIIPASVKTVEAEAFSNCHSLSGVRIASPDVSIGREAFGCTVTFTPTGQYSYVFIHGVLDDFVITCDLRSTAVAYADTTGLQTEFFGDVNQDKSVDLVDVIALNKNLMIGASVTPQGSINADVDCNGIADEVDSLNILKYIISIVPSFPLA